MNIGSLGCDPQENPAARALNSVRKHLTNELVTQCCRRAGYRWRVRLWPPLLTILACVWKQLQATASARQTEDWARALCPQRFIGKIDGSAFCAARARLPLAVLSLLAQEVGATAARLLTYTFHGLPVCIVDGTTLRTPNSADNDHAFGRSRNQSGLSRRPLLRLVIFACAGCSAILDAAYGPYIMSELELFLQLLGRMRSPHVLLADSAYCTYLIISRTRQQGSHIVSRLYHLRRGKRIRTLGRGDELQVWQRPVGKAMAHPELVAECPAELHVRVITKTVGRKAYKSVELSIVTTLLDPEAYPAEELIDLYLRRWNVELDLRTLKTHYGLELLSGKSADVVGKELWSTLLAHNCVAAIMAESGVPPRKLSHTRVRKCIIGFGNFMAWASDLGMLQLYRLMMLLIERMTLDHYPRLPQPRAVIQRNHIYPVLPATRAEWRRSHHGIA